jgi:acetylornithine deacetylase/succinyl-diaminopimelate desuccinylase-like protein
MEKVLNYIDQNSDRFLSELIEFLKIPSISSEPDNKPDMERAAKWLVDHLNSIGISNTKIIPTNGHSIVYAEWMGAGDDKPTVLLYGHYDVQPVDPLELWHSDPFDPQIKDGKIFARGTADDKGQLFTHLKAMEALFKETGKLPVNIKLLYEGEEEAGYSHLDEFIVENKEMLKCDTALISDTEWFADGMPTICYGLRGIVSAEITVTGPNRDVHSGSFGGAIENPLNALCWLMTQMKDKYGRITIPGFYDDVLEITPKEHEEFQQLPYNEQDYCDDLGINMVTGEVGYTTFERAWVRPTLDLNGIIGGYTGEGMKTIIPSKASAKFTMRLVPHQHPKDIVKKVEKYIRQIAPPTVGIEITAQPGGMPVLVPQDSPSVKAAIAAFKKVFGQEPVFMREGGSIPIVETFYSVLEAPSVLMGFGLPGDNIHSPNENFDLNNFYGGIKTVATFLNEISGYKLK